MSLKARFTKALKNDDGNDDDGGDNGFDRWYGADTADAMVAAYEASDWAALRTHYSSLPSWRARMRGLKSITFTEEPTALNGYIEASAGQDPLAVLLRGVAGVSWAWDARGGGRPDTVTTDGWTDFFERLRRADIDLNRAARLDPTNPIPWIEMLNSGRGLQIHKDEIELRFENLFRRDGASVEGHSNYLQSIAGKWSGSDERMWRFALDVHEHVPDGSPLKTVVAEAFIERYHVAEEVDASEGELKAAAQVVAAAADSSILHPDFAGFDPLDQSHALTWFATAFFYIGDDLRGARAVQMIGNSPSEWGLNYVPGRNAKKQWSKLQSRFNVSAQQAA